MIHYFCLSLTVIWHDMIMSTTIPTFVSSFNCCSGFVESRDILLYFVLQYARGRDYHNHDTVTKPEQWAVYSRVSWILTTAKF